MVVFLPGSTLSSDLFALGHDVLLALGTILKRAWLASGQQVDRAEERRKSCSQGGAQAIAQLREALGDSNPDPWVITHATQPACMLLAPSELLPSLSPPPL